MYDNKYLYFNNVLYMYNTVGYNKITFYDKEIIIITILDIMTNEFKYNLGHVIRNYMSFYELPIIKTIEMKNIHKIPSLKDLCIHKIQRFNLDYSYLNRFHQKIIKQPIFSDHDCHTHIIEYFKVVHKYDKKSLINFLIYIYNIYDLARIHDLLPNIPLPTP